MLKITSKNLSWIQADVTDLPLVGGDRILSFANATILCETTGGSIDLVLPEASTITIGKRVTIKKTNTGANNISVLRAGTDTIDGATSQTVSGDFGFKTFESNGVDQWYEV